jgi:hypothetical protein
MAEHASDRPPTRAVPERAISGTFERTAPDAALFSVLVDARNGTVIDCLGGLDPEGRLEGLAAAVPELLAAHRVSWEQVFGRLGGSKPVGLHDVILVSRGFVHVVQSLASDPQLALISIAPRTRNVGLIVAQTRDLLAQVDASR